ncbi:peptide-methionine (S)-S-oxide reductase MsrA [Paenibacillus sp. strain BS8-2]
MRQGETDAEQRSQGFRSSARECSSNVATFGMGCFWGPEAMFGALPGVIRTRVGYGGGSKVDPTYREMGDHTEMVQLQFDEHILSYAEIIREFWDKHNPVNINEYKGRQYQSLLFYHDESQKQIIDDELARRVQTGLVRPDTEIVAAAESTWYPAEERHQKYNVKRFPHAVAALISLFEDRIGDGMSWQDSTIAARLNGIAKGFSSMERLKAEIAEWNLGRTERDELLTALTAIRW